MKNDPPYLISLYVNIIIKDVLVCSRFFQKQSTGATEKKILSKFTNIFKYLYMNSQQQTNKITKMRSYSVVF